MLNIVCRNNTWYFHRRVPIEFKEFDSRRFVRSSLKTRCKKEAIRLAGIENTRLKEFWQSIKATGQYQSHEAHAKASQRSSVFGFEYLYNKLLADGLIERLIERVQFVFDQKINKHQAEAVLGMVPEPQIFLSDLFPKFLDYRKEEKLKKSERQYRRWKNPRKRSIETFINVVGNKVIQELCRQDFLDYKNHWIDRIDAEHLKTGTANKGLIQAKNVIETVCDNLKIKLDKEHLFSNLLFEDDYQSRLPYNTDHILNVILNKQKLEGLSDHYQKMIDVFAETGIHIDEQVGIKPEDIFLHHAIPHVALVPREKDKLKTKHRERLVPLVGFALDAFKAYPKGFSEIVTNSDSASSAIGKYLRENKMNPTERHSLYSLRHSFQDRLTELDCPDRTQTDLMGHAFKGRTKYGIGASLGHKQTWMKKIQLKHE